MMALYKGRRGSGKTITMVKDAFLNYKKGWIIYRNFNASFGNFIDNEEIINLDKHSTIQNALLMIDEIQIFFDSRQSMRKKNIQFSNFIQQVRKRNLIILCTTQYSNTIDLRLRQHLDILATPYHFKSLDVCEVTYTDLTSIESNFFMDTIPKSIKVVFDCKPIYKLYDTNEMIK